MNWGSMKVRFWQLWLVSPTQRPWRVQGFVLFWIWFFGGIFLFLFSSLVSTWFLKEIYWKPQIKMVMCAHVALGIFLFIITLHVFAGEWWISLEITIASTQMSISKKCLAEVTQDKLSARRSESKGWDLAKTRFHVHLFYFSLFFFSAYRTGIRLWTILKTLILT